VLSKLARTSIRYFAMMSMHVSRVILHNMPIPKLPNSAFDTMPDIAFTFKVQSKFFLYFFSLVLKCGANPTKEFCARKILCKIYPWSPKKKIFFIRAWSDVTFFYCIFVALKVANKN
jgi:hypothetical protein